jgi:hypothetical protein
VGPLPDFIYNPKYPPQKNLKMTVQLSSAPFEKSTKRPQDLVLHYFCAKIKFAKYHFKLLFSMKVQIKPFNMTSDYIIILFIVITNNFVHLM